jgi:hypothetical protein
VRWEGIWPALQSSRVRDQPTGEQPIAIARTRWPRASRNRLIQHSSSRAYVWTCGGGIKIEKATEDTAWLMPRRPRPAALGAAALHGTRPASAASRAPVSKPRERHADRSRPPVRHRPWARASRRATSRPTVRLLRARRGTRRELVVSVRKHERAQRRHTRPAEEKGGGHPLPVALQQRKAMAVADWQCCMLCRHGRSVLC